MLRGELCGLTLENGEDEMAKKEDFEFLSQDGKTNIHAVKWLPDDGEVRAVFQITHGMVEYIERYTDFAEYLTQHGFVVVGHDHLGHGESVESQDDLGFIHEKHGSDMMVADMHRLRQMTQREYPGLPYFMLGHSMGSYLLRKYLTIHGENLSGAIIMGTGTMPKAVMAFGKLMCRAIAGVRGWHYRSALMQDLSYAGAYQLYNLDGKDPENSWLTKDAEIVKKYYADPKCTFRFTVNGYYSLMDTVLYDSRQKNVNKIPKDLPLFLVSGDEDPVGDMGEGVKKVYIQLRKAGIQEVRCKLFRGDRHEVLNELDRQDVYRKILSWCKAHM